MARILIVIPDPPLPFGNAAARWYYVLIRGLTARGHHVTALASSDNPAHVAETLTLFPAPDYDVRVFPRRTPSWRNKPVTVLRPYSYLFGEALHRAAHAEMAKGVDVLHLEQQWAGWIGLKYLDRALINIQYLFEIDLADRPVRTLRERALQLVTKRAERRLLRRYETITTLSPRLTEHVRGIAPHAAIHTVPLGLDCALYPYVEEESGPHAPTLGLVGSFDWYPSLSAGVRLLERLWPEIKRRVPGARLVIAGRRAKVLEKHSPGADVTIFENVPDIIPYFRQMDVMLYAPTRGSGMKVKVLEAFALGVPVVTTTDGVEGVPAVDRVHAGISETDAGLIERAVELLTDPARRVQQRRAARALISTHCSPHEVLNGLERVYQSMSRVAPGCVRASAT